MEKRNLIENFCEFVKDGSCSFTAVAKISEILKSKGFKKLEETDKWQLETGNYFVTRNDATIIAFTIPEDYFSSFMICTTHCDSPSLCLKPQGEHEKNNYKKFNVMPYGGLLNYGWLDRPLSLAGRIVIKNNEQELTNKIIDLKEAIAVVPSVAVHQNDKANSNLDLNAQDDLQPIISLKTNQSLMDYIKDFYQIDGEIMDYDLYFYNMEEPQLIGLEKDLLVSPRIDNLTSVYSALQGFLESTNKAINVFVAFNNEEIGSLTKEGAESSFLLDILKRIATSLKLDLAKTLAHTFVVSSDNTHAIHPNHEEYMDDTGNLDINKGLAIVKEVNSTTDGYFSTLFKMICNQTKALYQDATIKNDISSGSTLSTLSLRHVSVKSIDIGIPQLAMHSSFECCGTEDIYYLYLAIKQFYQTYIKIDKEKTKLIFS